MFTVTNTATELTGTFGVAKQVDGDFDLSSPQIAEAVFTVTASWPAAPGLRRRSVVLTRPPTTDSRCPPASTCPSAQW